MASRRVILLVLDACGIGAAPDAPMYGDAMAATLPHVAASVGGLNMPYAESLGLGCIAAVQGIRNIAHPVGSHGFLTPRSAGKDSTTGHWEIAGLLLHRPFPLFPDGFPPELVKRFESAVGVSVIGNCAASGTEIIERLGPEHIHTGKLILYTSADSVFQLAAHETICPLSHLYEICAIARNLLQGEFGVARVIARPFIGEPGSFTRTAGRRDFSLPPSGVTVLDQAFAREVGVLSIGKIYDLFAGRGISTAIKTADNDEVMAAVIRAVRTDKEHRLIFANCVDFDMLWGHRNDPVGFARGLEAFDTHLGALLNTLKENDVLIITADHGCDPTITTSTDHTREFVPVLIYGRALRPGIDLGARSSFADIGATVAEALDLSPTATGSSFWPNLLP